MSPLARIVRTVVQVVVACAGLVPLVVALLGEAGVSVDGARLVAIAAAAIALVTAAQNALEQAGLIPTIGSHAEPRYDRDEIARALGRQVDIPAAQRVLDTLDEDGA